MKNCSTKNVFQRMGIKKVAYLKYGNVLSEYEQIQNQESGDGDIGYLSRFYALSKNTSMTLISFDHANAKLRKDGSHIYVFELNKGNRTLKKILNNLYKVIITLKLLVKNKPDFILCGRIDTSFFGAFIASKLISKPIILSSHHALPLGNGKYDRLRRILYKKLIRHCDSVMCNGPYLKKEMISAGVSCEKLVEFLPTFGELKKDSNSEDISKYLNSYILFVGRTERNKGVYDLLSAYRKILNTCKKTNLVYAGNGSSFDDLKIKAKDFGLDDKVIFLGQVPYCKLGELIRNSRFVVIPSKSTMTEGICKVVLESQLLGKPVIVPDYGVFPYIVKNRQNGLIFKTDSVTDLAEKMMDLLCNQELYNSLKTGAIAEGKKFETPETTFSDAILTSLKKVGFNSLKANS